jgi:hypothetical protein
MSELRPCPCCGSKAIMEHSIGEYYCYIVCSNDFCSIGQRAGFATEQKAIEVWNKRTHGTCKECKEFLIDQKGICRCRGLNKVVARDTSYCANWKER